MTVVFYSVVGAATAFGLACLWISVGMLTPLYRLPLWVRRRIGLA